MRGFGANELLECYARGVFPMAEGRDDPRIYLLDPDQRGILPLDDLHIPRRLQRTVRQDAFRISINLDFHAVVTGCCQAAPGREETWINDGIFSLYAELHRRGHAHSVECWRGSDLVGGLYGVSLGGAFFGESMFSLRRDASKVALVHLLARLIAGGYALLDTQFTTGHLETFGARSIARADYKARLAQALEMETDFFALPAQVSGARALFETQGLQSSTQTS